MKIGIIAEHLLRAPCGVNHHRRGVACNAQGMCNVTTETGVARNAPTGKREGTHRIVPASYRAKEFFL